MKIVLPGGTGQVGAILDRALTAEGHEVVLLTRSPRGERQVRWDGCTLGDRARRGHRRAARPPRLWMQMSTATIYAHRFDAANDEYSGLIGGGERGVPGYGAYGVKIAQNWEAAQEQAATPGTRKIALRSAMVMSPGRGGVFDVLSWLARRGLGGPVNLAAPGPLPQREFMRELRSAWRMPVGLPATRWMAEIGAFAVRSDTELLLKSRRVTPGRLTDAGFTFDYPQWRAAAADLASRRRRDGRRN